MATDVSTHPTFQQRLLDSDEAVWAVEQWAHRRGYWVTIPPLRIARTFGERKQYADVGDLFLGVTADERKRCEVKEITSTLTGLHDFRWPVFLVMTLEQWRQKVPKPTWVFIVSKGRKHVGVVAGAMSGHWSVVDRRDDFWGRESVLYMAAPLWCVKWYALDEGKPELQLMIETTNGPPPDLTAAPLVLPGRRKLIVSGQGDLWSA